MPTRKARGKTDDARWAGRDKFAKGDLCWVVFQTNRGVSDWGHRQAPEGVRIPVRLLERRSVNRRGSDETEWRCAQTVDGSIVYIFEKELILDHS